MVSGFHAGAIAGVAGGLAAVASHVLNIILGLSWLTQYELPGLLVFETLINHIVVEIGLTAIYGAIFGLIYSKFYERIPGKGIKKSFIFSMMFYLISNIYLASFAAAYGNLPVAGGFAWAGFWTLAVYGIVLGAIHER
jgi:hypothetical protein